MLLVSNIHVKFVKDCLAFLPVHAIIVPNCEVLPQCVDFQHSQAIISIVFWLPDLLLNYRGSLLVNQFTKRTKM